MTISNDTNVPGYLGRIMKSVGSPAGTCFQVKPGILVTAWHVLVECEAGQEGQLVLVDSLALGGGPPGQARVEKVDPVHDLGILRLPTPMKASAELYEPSGVQRRVRLFARYDLSLMPG